MPGADSRAELPGPKTSAAEQTRNPETENQRQRSHLKQVRDKLIMKLGMIMYGGKGGLAEAMSFNPQAMRDRLESIRNEGKSGQAKQRREAPFGDVLAVSRVINKLREGESPADSELEKAKRLLRITRKISDEILKTMRPEEIIAAAQFALPFVDISSPIDSDFLNPKGSKKRKAEEALANKEIDRARQVDEGKLLVPEEIAEHLKVEPDNAKVKDGKDEITQELVYEEDLPIGKDVKYKVSLYKRSDGSHVMSRLPTNKYDSETVKRFLKKAGIDIDLPKDWAKKSVDEKIDFLKSKGLDTLSEVLNFRPTDWGWRDPNRAGNEPYGTFVSEMEFRDLILEQWESLNPPQPLTPQQLVRQQEIQAEIARRINSNDALWVFDANLDLRDIREEIRGDLQKQNELNQILAPQLQTDLETARNNLEIHYQQLLQTAGEESLSDIKTAANQEFLMLQQNWRVLDESIRRIRESAASKREIPGREGLRIWYSTKQIELLQDAYMIFKRTELQVDPIENLRAAEEVMRFFEQSKTQEIFGLARERLVRMLQAVQNSHDPRVTPTTKERLRKRFNSFEFMNSLLIASDESEGAPDKMHPVAVRFDDESWQYFYDRFVADEIKDRGGRHYLIDGNGNLVNLNLQGELENSISEQYLVDRWRVNRVVDMMGRDLNQNNPFNIDETLIINRINSKIQQRNLHGVDFNQVWGVDGHFDEIERRWVADNDVYHDIKMEAIQEWYQERTLLGADGYDTVLDFNGNRIQRQRKENWLDTSIQWHLRNKLQNAGVTADRINDLLGELQNPNQPFDPIPYLNNNPNTPNPSYNPIARAGDYELIYAVRRNAYDLAKFKLADTLDRFRIYTKSGKQIDTVWGEDTPYMARAVTNFADWCLNEGQGDARVVRELIRHMDRNWGGADINPAWQRAGHLLSQNSTAYRFFAMKDAAFIRQVIIDENSPLGQRINTLIANKTALTGDPRRDVEGYIWENQILEGIDPNNPNDVNRDLVRVDWQTISKEIKSYPVHDMLFDRQAVLKWYLEDFRAWLNRPLPQQFFNMMEKYYSFRNVRQHPGAEFFLELQWELGKHWKDWYDYDENLSIAEFERYIDKMQQLNLIDEKRAERLLGRVSGSKSQLTSKEIQELVGEGSKQTVRSPAWWAGTATKFLTDVIWPFLRYLVTGK